MCRRKLRNGALYLLFLINCGSAIKNGIDWLFIIAAVLTGAVLIIDITEAIKNRREK